MNDYERDGRDWMSIWVSYELHSSRKPNKTRNEKSVATIEELKRQVGVTPLRS